MKPETDNAVAPPAAAAPRKSSRPCARSQSLTGTKLCLPSSTSITRKLKLWELASWSSSYTQGGLIAASEWNRESLYCRADERPT